MNPRLLIAAPASGTGKTSVAIGLCAALARRGLRVAPFKVGPDFLDPTYLSRAAGQICYNLDGWMTSKRYVRSLLERKSAEADLAVMEGVMGLFDGASPETLAGSSAEVARWTDTPVLLVVNAHGMARSIAPLVAGFSGFDPKVNVAGVIANHIGSETHRQWLVAALESANLPPLLGAIPRGALPELPSRHLGLVTANSVSLSDEAIAQLANACETYLDLDAIESLAASAGPLDAPPAATMQAGPTVRLGVAQDEAFHFAYPDNIEALTAAGAEIVPFSPLHDAALPENLAALYFPGGYPEEYAAQLAANRPMLQSVSDFAETGRVIYGECGGLMYLGHSLEDRKGNCHKMTALLPLKTRMRKKRKRLGYAEAHLQANSLWGQAGDVIKGHEFHYSEIIASDIAPDTYQIIRRAGRNAGPEGFAAGQVLGSYIHLHWASNPQAVTYFLDTCRRHHD